jgi:hypothetical protein
MLALPLHVHLHMSCSVVHDEEDQVAVAAVAAAAAAAFPPPRGPAAFHILQPAMVHLPIPPLLIPIAFCSPLTSHVSCSFSHTCQTSKSAPASAPTNSAL